MKMIGKTVALGCALIALVGCSSKFEQIRLNKDIDSARVAILPVNYIDKPGARVDKNLVKFAGTLGRAAVIKAEDARRRKLTDALAAEGYVYQQDMDAYLLEAVPRLASDVRFIEFSRSIDNILEAVPPGRFEKKYPEDIDADYLLDIYIEDVGFVAESLGADYLPLVHLGVRVVDADSLVTVFQSEVQYNPESEPDAPVIAVGADTALAFENTDALLDNPARAREALSTAIHAAVDALIDHLEMRAHAQDRR